MSSGSGRLDFTSTSSLGGSTIRVLLTGGSVFSDGDAGVAVGGSDVGVTDGMVVAVLVGVSTDVDVAAGASVGIIVDVAVGVSVGTIV